MKYLKIVNISQENTGMIDYKGLDIDLFIAGSQVYDEDIAYIATMEEETPSHEDLQVLTEEEYLQYTDEIKNRPQPPTEIDLLNQKIAEQDNIIEDLLFNIVPSLAGGEA